MTSPFLTIVKSAKMAGVNRPGNRGQTTISVLLEIVVCPLYPTEISSVLLGNFDTMMAALRANDRIDIEQRFLDIHTVRAHVANNPTSFARNLGAVALGAENKDYFV